MASKASSIFHPILRHSLWRTTASSCPFQQLSRAATRTSPSLVALRFAHSIPRPPLQGLTPEAEARAKDSANGEAISEGKRPPVKPECYQISFTCVPCGHRSHHNVSKQGYHRGSTLITCPSCRNRHVISDHLNIFGDRKITVEDLMREKGQLVKRGRLGEDGDIEFWPEEEANSEQSDDSGKQ
ncbi:hypothetical protein E4U60_000178 [Claviceps pazoutovae]|uniref:DNL-type domain-containing protein n=1 Tax=Claviceps pazoutovae TaxID=1649127 RepID=A0A9P7MF56_9HYPO|nr:hypothetical protein E4U60_000178 [Claviceps pazoutovae]